MQDQHLSADTRAILAALRERDDKQRQQIGTIRDAQRTLQQEVANIARGFPDGDPDSHRRYHESVIEWRELRNKMVRDALTHAAKVGGIGAACWVAYAVWTAFKMEVLK